jgi:uroporphyrinogen-III decarboxylase
LPGRYRGWNLRDIERDLDMGTPARDGRVFRTSVRGVEVRSRSLDSLTTVTETATPVGTVSALFRGSDLLRATGIGDLQTEFILKRREDYAVAEYLVEQTDYEETYAEYVAYEKDVGEDGYPLVSIGDCPFHHWMRSLVGYSNAYYHLNDYPNEVERLLTVMTERDRETVWKLAADSPARLLLHGVHFSDAMTPPSVFRQFITPYYDEFSRLLRSHGKTLALHADNNTRGILRDIEDAGYGMVECFVTAPMVETTLAEAKKTWDNRVIIWGGIPSAILEEPYTDEQFDAYLDNLFATIAPGDAFILGVADNVMPGAKLDRLERVSEAVAARGRYPIAAAS